jgi:hypothetical protein
VIDDELGGTWTALGPTGLQRQRMEARVFSWLEARDTPLALEWLGLFRVTPLSAIGLLAASTASLATATPILWLARALL